jgi:hypothetical protein
MSALTPNLRHPCEILKTRKHRQSDPGDGTFRIVDVPPGQYYLQQGSFYVSTDARSLSLDRYELGRRNRTASTSPVTVKLSLSNLSPMPDGSYLYLQGSTSNLGSAVYVDGQSPVLGGATSVTDYTSSWSDSSVVEGSKGDLFDLYQKVDHTNGPTYLLLGHRAGAGHGALHAEHGPGRAHDDQGCMGDAVSGGASDLRGRLRVPTARLLAA